MARSVAGLKHVWARTRHSTCAHVNRKDWTRGTGNLPCAPLMAYGSVGTAPLAAKRTKETKGTGSGEEMHADVAEYFRAWEADLFASRHRCPGGLLLKVGTRVSVHK